MDYLVLLGIVIVIVGFALKLDSILIIFAAAIVTALVGGIGIDGFLTTLGTSFVSNRSMAVFIIILLVVGTLERNGLKDAAAALIGKAKNATPGIIIALYGVMRVVFAAFNVSFGGVAGFVRPIIMPMAIGAIEASGHEPKDEYVEELKGMASGMENVAWFFGQMLFVGTAGALLVQSTLKPLGYDVDLLRMALIELPVAIIAVVVTAVYYILKDHRLRAKYYGAASASANVKEA
ncbi:hypothetical protein G1C98_0699 [Bifidobacterium sp. DSM 109960]|uniref:DUF969 domain-containing protein n=1 Tax=Bifidobacterium erythrocebi TaxID=2675325 RepID=A0A7Y0ET71_9BIFI|nr:DUF969 domain-containing protein [Bifidobacterium sp. DSM 109960]NMM95963.1 hypothetical protein [Bifidobacterium sp. DSM 109960]